MTLLNWITDIISNGKQTLITGSIGCTISIENVETQLIGTRAKKQEVEVEKLTGDNVYKVLIYFEKLYVVMNEVEQWQLMEEVVCQFVRQNTNNDKQENHVEKDSLENVKVKDGKKKRIDYRAEEIQDCGCIYG